MIGQVTDNAGVAPVEMDISDTVGQRLDKKIANKRIELENLCVLKAKAETLQILNFPHAFLCDVIHTY